MAGLILLPVFLLIAVSIGAVLLRAAVALANKVLGPVAIPDSPDTIGPPPGTEPQASTIANPLAASENPFAIQTTQPAATPVLGDDAAQTGNPYAMPAVAATGAIPSAPRSKSAIQEPNFGKAIGIVFVQGFAAAIINAIINIGGLQAGLDPILISSLSFLLVIFISIAIYAGMLPTSFGKAALVYVFCVLIGVLLLVSFTLAIAGISAFFPLA